VLSATSPSTPKKPTSTGSAVTDAFSDYTICFVMACGECMFMPFGTVLGVFTILVLNRQSVKGLFAPGT
jgi:hypothetical protein